ncbi:MAG: phosphoribosylformylglycinamidine cyclo-ligase [Acidimicrobiales bacterium]
MTAGTDGGGARAGLTYGSAGVDTAAAGRAVEAIGHLVASTRTEGVVGSIGGFGGLFALPGGYQDPLLVASTDGVGTKTAVAAALGRWDTIGIDLVAMCVDDVVCCGARPLFLLDYQLLGRLDPDQVSAVMTGIAAGCRQAGCAILGGELAEHPGLLGPGQLDVAGFAVGIVERSRLLDGSAPRPGDVLIGLASPGLRANGYALARRALLDVAGRDLADPAWPGADRSLGDELLLPSVIYAPAVGTLLRTGPEAGVEVRAVAHVTGGGLPGNLPRVLPDGVDAVVDRSTWVVPPIFAEIQRAGGIDDAEMARVFNLGMGMVVVVPPRSLEGALVILAGAGRPGTVVGELVASDAPAGAENRVRFRARW